MAQASLQLQAPPPQPVQVAGQPYIQVLESTKNLLEDFRLIHEDACHGFKASTTLSAVGQGFAASVVTVLGIVAAALPHPPRTLNILTRLLVLLVVDLLLCPSGAITLEKQHSMRRPCHFICQEYTIYSQYWIRISYRPSQLSSS